MHKRAYPDSIGILEDLGSVLIVEASVVDHQLDVGNKVLQAFVLVVVDLGLSSRQDACIQPVTSDDVAEQVVPRAKCAHRDFLERDRALNDEVVGSLGQRLEQFGHRPVSARIEDRGRRQN